MATIIHEHLVLWSFFKVYLDYSKKTVDEKRIRPISGFQSPEDLEHAIEFISLFNSKWSREKGAWELQKRSGEEPEKPCFSEVRGELLSELAQKHGWTEEKLNLFESVHSTYIHFKNNRVSKEDADQLREIERIFMMIHSPNEEVL